MERPAPFNLDARLEFPADALARPPQGTSPDHLLKASVWDDDFALRLQYPLPYPQDGLPTSDVLQLLVNGTLVGDVVDLLPYAPGDTLEVTLYAADRPTDTAVDRLPAVINYQVMYRAGAGFDLGPSDQAFITDIVAPGRGFLEPLLFDPDVVANGVTLDALVDDGSGNLYLPATVRPYAEAAAGDWIAGLIDSDASLLTPVVEITAGQVGTSIQLRFPLPLLESAGDGTHQFTYLVEDRAELRSAEASPVPLEIRLKVAPVITSVSGAGGDVANGGTTFDTELTVSGTALANKTLQLFDGDTLKGTVNVDAGGKWDLLVSGLAVGDHRFKALGVYDTLPESAVYSVTVALATVPAITSVRDTRGEVRNGETTFDTALDIAGPALANQEVELFDGTTSKGIAPVSASGTWGLRVSGLALGIHDFKARGLYANQPESAVHRVVVDVATAPVITSVSGAGGAVPNGGTTFDTALTVSGNAKANQTVQIFDNNTSKGNAPVNASGVWSLAVSGLAVGGHSFKARALYGSQPESGLWNLTVKQRLTIDTSVLTLAGALVRHGRTPTVPPPSTSATRTASGGTPPYTYSASTNAVDINPSTGNVISHRNGQATVTVRDAAGLTAAYTVVVSNVLELDGWFGYNIYSDCVRHAQSLGGRMPTQYEWLAYAAAYGGDPQLPPAQGNMEAWSSTSAGGNLLHTFVPNTGVQGNQPNQSWIIGGRGGAAGWAIFTRYAS